MVITGRHCVYLLDDLHQEHHGICCMKLLVRGYSWWPGLAAAILRGFSNVTFVLPWENPFQGHHCTLLNGLLSHGSVSTFI